MLENLTIIRVGLLNKLQTKARLWGLGWILSAITIIICSVLTYRVYLLNALVQDTLAKQNETLTLQSAQATALINGWHEHSTAVERLTEWVEWAKERQSIVNANRGMITDRRTALGLK